MGEMNKGTQHQAQIRALTAESHYQNPEVKFLHLAYCLISWP